MEVNVRRSTGMTAGVMLICLGLVIFNRIDDFIKESSIWSFYSFLFITLGYMAKSLFLEYIFYYKSGANRGLWKIQCDKGTVGKMFGPPILGVVKPNRHPLHRLFSSINIFQAGLFAFFTCELSIRGWNKMYFDEVSLLKMAVELTASISWQSVAEYWWHILMHQPKVYKVLHKYHHYYKSPEPFDDLFIHPLESAGYYCILYSIPFVMSVHCNSMLVYMAIMGVFGVMDHSGVKFTVKIPFLGVIYDSTDHDIHHKYFDFNYAFPFPVLDVFHGTYWHQK